MLTLKNVKISRGPHTLLDQVTMNIYAKNVIGLIGANGCGKSTLLSAISGNYEIDAGEINLHKGIQVQSIQQEVPASEISALEYTFSGDKVLFTVLEKLKQAEKNHDDEAIMRCHMRLSEIDGYSSESRAAKILVGLGFQNEEIYQTVQSFSGGWRMRLNLAKCLFAPSDLLLLDEPTNHLDLEGIFWLENFIKSYPGAILIVSHDRDFLDHTVTQIAHIENKTLTLYGGNYSQFEVERANALLLQHAQYQKQQAKIKHMMSFVDRFRAKATKAKQAQSRLKAIERMELVAPVYAKSEFTFEFTNPTSQPNPMVIMHHANLGYEDKTVLYKVNLSITAAQRIGLLGKNGEGKSTLIKAICGILAPQQGSIEIFSGTKIGYFAQNQIDYLPVESSPLEFFRDHDRSKTEKDWLSFLGRFKFNRDQALAPIDHLSGGEKARIALAYIIWQKPNLLLLDEPTNHLDMEVREALTQALQTFTGSLILVSHDRYLLRTLVDELFIVKNKSVSKFDGTVDDYQALEAS